jgi:hypothetical protein
METTLTIYDLETGAIKYTVSIDEIYAADQGEYGDGALDGDYRSDQFYVDLETHQPVAKTPLTYSAPSLTVPADGTTELVISGLPVPASARGPFGKILVEDGSLELTFDTPGSYTVTLSDESPRSLPVTLTIEATEP